MLVPIDKIFASRSRSMAAFQPNTVRMSKRKQTSRRAQPLPCEREAAASWGSPNLPFAFGPLTLAREPLVSVEFMANKFDSIDAVLADLA